MLDRMKAAFVALARGADEFYPYRCLYRGYVKSQLPWPNLRVTVAPESPLLPEMTDIPLKTGVPGINVVLRLQGVSGPPPTIPVLIGWEIGRPDRPFAALWTAGKLGVPRDNIERVIIEGLRIELGAEGLDPIRDGVLTGQSIDMLTGVPQWMLANASTTVLAKK